MDLVFTQPFILTSSERDGRILYCLHFAVPDCNGASPAPRKRFRQTDFAQSTPCPSDFPASSKSFSCQKAQDFPLNMPFNMLQSCCTFYILCIRAGQSNMSYGSASSCGHSCVFQTPDTPLHAKRNFSTLTSFPRNFVDVINLHLRRSLEII